MELTQASECKRNDDFTASIDEAAQPVCTANAAESFEEVTGRCIMRFHNDVAFLVDVTGKIISTILFRNSDRYSMYWVGRVLENGNTPAYRPALWL